MFACCAWSVATQASFVCHQDDCSATAANEHVFMQQTMSMQRSGDDETLSRRRRKKYGASTDAFQELLDKVAALAEEVATTKAELQDMADELSNTKDELAQTQAELRNLKNGEPDSEVPLPDENEGDAEPTSGFDFPAFSGPSTECKSSGKKIKINYRGKPDYLTKVPENYCRRCHKDMSLCQKGGEYEGGCLCLDIKSPSEGACEGKKAGEFCKFVTSDRLKEFSTEKNKTHTYWVRKEWNSVCLDVSEGNLQCAPYTPADLPMNNCETKKDEFLPEGTLCLRQSGQGSASYGIGPPRTSSEGQLDQYFLTTCVKNPKYESWKPGGTFCEGQLA